MYLTVRRTPTQRDDLVDAETQTQEHFQQRNVEHLHVPFRKARTAKRVAPTLLLQFINFFPGKYQREHSLSVAEFLAESDSHQPFWLKPFWLKSKGFGSSVSHFLP